MKLILTLFLILPFTYSCDKKKGRDPASLRKQDFDGMTSGRGFKSPPTGKKSEEEKEKEN